MESKQDGSCLGWGDKRKHQCQNSTAGTSAREMAQCIRVIAAKPEDLGSIPKTGRLEREKLMPTCCPLTSTYMPRQAYACTHTIHVTTTIIKSVNGPDIMRVALSLFGNEGFIIGNYMTP
jgi:hypothetical protein